MLTLDQILAKAPPSPDCFPSRLQWASYLLSAQHYSKKPPFAHGRWQRDFNFCADCTHEHAAAMKRADKCNPLRFKSIPVVVVVAEVA